MSIENVIVIVLSVLLGIIIIGYVMWYMKSRDMIFRKKMLEDVHMSLKEFKIVYSINPSRYRLQDYYVTIVTSEGLRVTKMGFIEFNFIDRMRYQYWKTHPNKVKHPYLTSLHTSASNTTCVDSITNDIEEYLNRGSKKDGD